MGNNKETIIPGKYVELGYDLYQVDAYGTETLVHQTNPEDPERIIYGVTEGVIRPLEQALEGKSVGDAFDVKATADEAFGQPDPEAIMSLDKEIFVVDGKFDAEHIRPGATVPMMTADGFRINGLVTEVSSDKVTMDFNHPLAGKAVRLVGKVVAVRDATPEELHPAQGCGCSHCGDGNCGDGECGDGECGGCCH